MISFILLTFLIILSLIFLNKYLKWRKQTELLIRNVPGWKTVPVLGNALKFIGDENVFLRRIEEMAEISDKYGRFKLWMGPKLFFFTTVPEDILTINNVFLDKTPFYKFADMWIKNGLTVAPAEVWKKSIKRVHSSFSTTAVDSFQGIFNLYGRKIATQLAREVGKEPFDANRKYVSFVTLEAICHTMMGVANVDEKIITKEYCDAFENISKLLMSRIQNILYYPDGIYKLTRNYRQLKKSIQILQDVANTVIAKKRIEFKEKEIINAVKDEKRFKSLLENLLKQSENDEELTDERIRAECDNFITAGQETVALSSTLIFLMLGSYPEVQDKLFDEIKDIFGDDDRDVTKDDLDRMVYAEAVINETLRIYPTVPLMMRQADHNLELDGCTIPKGAACVIFAWGSCRSRRLWGDDAREFNPERWFRADLPHPAAFTTFSYGRRNCLGKKYAISFLKTILVHSVRQLVFSSDVTKLQYHINLTVHPVTGHHIQVRYRH